MADTITAGARTELAALLGPDFEPGSENGRPSVSSPPNQGAGGPLPAAGPSPAAGAADSGGYSGTINISDGKVLLTSGGIRVEVLVAGEVPARESLPEERRRAVAAFRRFEGQAVRLTGEQRNGYIIHAAHAGGTDSYLSEAARDAFARVAEVIARRGHELYSYEGVVNVRPGFRFRNGQIMDEPAIVVSVRAKREAAQLPLHALLPPSVEGVPVDVAAATPEEQLRDYLRRKGGAEAAALPPQLAEGPLALPYFEAARAEPVAEAAERLEALSDINYQPPPHVQLNEVTGPMTVVCHVSPDAGWPTLRRELFDRIAERMTVAMYDFTAPHVLGRLRSVMSQAAGDLKLILGPKASLGGGTKADDIAEEKVVARLRRALTGRFRQVWANVSGPDRIFANSYHIKVAVGDGHTFWLSSGNWQSSNQPDLDPLGADADLPGILQDFNREWHVVVHHPGLARVFEQFIEWDIEHAVEAAPEAAELPAFFLPPAPEAAEAAFVPRYFKPERFRFTAADPLRVQPLLTPDNYARHILDLIRSARERLYFQNQSLSILRRNEPAFDELVNALRDKSRDRNIDVRIILRGEFGARQMLEAMKARGFDAARVRFQDRCHTKGIIVDSRAVVVSSHNWTNSGTLFNRDAGLIFHHPRIAGYYENIFLYDWEHLATSRTRDEEAMPILAEAAGAVPAGAELISLDDLFD